MHTLCCIGLNYKAVKAYNWETIFLILSPGYHAILILDIALQRKGLYVTMCILAVFLWVSVTYIVQKVAKATPCYALRRGCVSTGSLMVLSVGRHLDLSSRSV